MCWDSLCVSSVLPHSLEASRKLSLGRGCLYQSQCLQVSGGKVREPQDGLLPQLVDKEIPQGQPELKEGKFRPLPLVGDVAKNLQLSRICQNKYEKGEINEFIGRSEFWSRKFQLNAFIHVHLNIKWTIELSACSC